MVTMTGYKPVETEAHQSWPPKKKTKRQIHNIERQRKKEKNTKYVVVHKMAKDKYKNY